MLAHPEDCPIVLERREDGVERQVWWRVQKACGKLEVVAFLHTNSVKIDSAILLVWCTHMTKISSR